MAPTSGEDTGLTITSKIVSLFAVFGATPWVKRVHVVSHGRKVLYIHSRIKAPSNGGADLRESTHKIVNHGKPWLKKRWISRGNESIFFPSLHSAEEEKQDDNCGY